MTPEQEHDERAVRLALTAGQANLRLARVRAVVERRYHESICDRIQTISSPCNCWKAQILAALDGPLS